MFNKKEKRSQNHIESLIGASTLVEGDLSFVGGVRIDGKVKGSVITSDEESGKLVEGVRQRDIETVLPKPGGEVIVLGGSRRGQRAKLMDINKRREVATLQIHQDMSIVKVHLDDAAQYMLRDDWMG